MSTKNSSCDNTETLSLLENIEISGLSNFVQFSYPMAIANCVIVLLLPIFTITGNLLLIVTVFKNHELRKNVANLLLVSLSVTDLTVGIFCQTSIVVPLLRVLREPTQVLCLFKMRAFFDFIGLTCMNASIQGLCLLNVDRFIAIVYPFKYPTLVTTRKIRYVIAFSWVLSFILTLLWIPMKTRTVAKGLWCFVTTSACTAILICHGSVAKVAKRHRRKIKDQQRTLQSVQAGMRQELKSFYTIGFLTLALLVCYTPELATQILLSNSTRATHGKKLSLVIDIIHPWTMTLYLMNSTINPYLYFWRSKRFREHVRRLLYTAT